MTTSTTPFPPEETLTLSDGRTLSYGIYGDRDAAAAGRTVFYHHGFPGTHAEARSVDAAARRRGLRVVCVDRPGMGGSTFAPDRRLRDWPADLLAVADHVGAARFAVVGVSGGGPYAVACYHAIPRARCVGAAVVAGLWPGELGGRENMMFMNKAIFFTAQWSTWVIEKAADFTVMPLVRDTAHPEKFEEAMGKAFQDRPGPDRDVWNNTETGARESLLESSRSALRNGTRGMAWEAYIYASDWGFKLEDVRVEKGKLVIWQGELDVNCPPEMARRAKAVLGDDAELRMSPDDAHLSLVVNKAEEVIETVAQMMMLQD